ncbi:MAG: transcriptional regulator, partial [Nocardia sp.]|nr:transcriptional regulator [Nocardia sp.]
EPDTLRPGTDTTCRLTATRDDDPAWLAIQLMSLAVPFRVRDSPELTSALRVLTGRLVDAVAD